MKQLKTRLQIQKPLIIIMRVAGMLALIVSIANLLGYGKADWKINMILGLLWLILASIDEFIARTQDIAKDGISCTIIKDVLEIKNETDK